jgi:hypothetical protein
VAETLARQGGPAWLEGWPERVVPPAPPAPPPSAEEIRLAVDRKVEELLAQTLAELQEQPEQIPADADHLAGLVRDLLAQCRDAGHRYGVYEVEHLPPPRSGARPTYDLSIRQRGRDGGPDLRTGVLFLTQANAVAVTGFLRRLLEDPRPLDRVVLVTDERVGLNLGGRGREYLLELQERGPQRFHTLELSLPEDAELAALQRVVGLARSRDLEVELPPGQVRAVTDREVIDSYHRHGRYLSSRLLRAVLDWAEEPAAAAATAEEVTPPTS